MRSLTILAAALASLSAVHAAFIFPRQNIPTCAQKCFAANYIPTAGCSPTDNACLCNNPTFAQNSLNCITNACSSQADVDETIHTAALICTALGINKSPDGVTTAAPGQPKTFTTLPVPTSSSTAATTAKSGAASAPIGVNQPLVALFGAAAVALGVAL